MPSFDSQDGSSRCENVLVGDGWGSSQIRRSSNTFEDGGEADERMNVFDREGKRGFLDCLGA
jgi:hypothetical protein